MIYKLIIIVFIGIAFGEEIILEPGKPFKFSTPGYPNPYEKSGETAYNFKSSPGSQIYAYCDDYRPVGHPNNPCESFTLKFDDGNVVKEFCSLDIGENVYHLSASNTIRIHMKYPISQMVSCVVRSTEGTIPEQITLTPSNTAVSVFGVREAFPYMDRTWLIKSQNGEKITIECAFYPRKTPLCYAERYEMTIGSEKRTICEDEKIDMVTDKEILLRAVYDYGGYGGPSCYFTIPSTPIPPPTPPPKPTVIKTEKIFLYGDKVHKFTSPCYPFGNDCQKTDTTYIFESVSGSKIDLFCDDFRMAGGETPCSKYQVTFDDGKNIEKICETSSNVYKGFQTNKLTVNMRFDRSVGIRCYARTTAVPNPIEVTLGLHDLPYRFGREYKDPKLPHDHRQYIFTTDPKFKVSLQCDINFYGKEPCTISRFDVNDGEETQSFCGSNKLVVFSKNNIVKATVQLSDSGWETYKCFAQAISGPDKDQHKNLVSEEVDSSERGFGPGRVKTTCDCGRRVPLKQSAARIYAGKHAREGDYTWVVGIRDRGNFQRCGGSLISQYHVLTAAHCMVDDMTRKRDEIYETVIAIAAHDLRTNQDESASHGETQFIDVLEKNVFIPEEYWRFKKHYDISVLLMEKPVKFGLHVSPACLAKKTTKSIWNREIKVTGWGKTEEQRASETLKETKTFVISSEICNMDPWIMCTYKNWTGTCSGDSGSPLVDWDPDTNRYTQVSLVSFGYTIHCAPGYSGNTNVTYFYDWILSKVKETKPSVELCYKVEE